MILTGTIYDRLTKSNNPCMGGNSKCSFFVVVHLSFSLFATMNFAVFSRLCAVRYSEFVGFRLLPSSLMHVVTFSVFSKSLGPPLVFAYQIFEDSTSPLQLCSTKSSFPACSVYLLSLAQERVNYSFLSPGHKGIVGPYSLHHKHWDQWGGYDLLDLPQFGWYRRGSRRSGI